MSAPRRAREVRLTARDRAAVWILTGPVGRVLAFFGDIAAYWWRWLRGRLRPNGG